MTSKLRGAIAAGHPKTAEAGIEMFRLGGNVFDAVVAAVLAACVVEPTLTSLGGGGFLLAHTADNRNTLFDFFTQTPRQQRNPAEVDFYPVDVNFGTVTQEFHVGLGSIAVPGTVAGLFHVHQRLGRLPFKAIAAPAIHYATTGVEIEAFPAYCFSILEPIVLGCPEACRTYAPGQILPQPGTVIKLPELAATLSYLAEAGARAFYEGEMAQQLVNDCSDRGGYLTLDDLTHYQVIERSPLSTTYRGNTLLTNPPPSSGGSLIAFSLALLAQVQLSDLEFGSADHLRTLVEVMRLTNHARTDGYDARLYQPNVAERFLAPEHLNPYLEKLSLALNRADPWGDLSSSNKWGSTTHISAMDAEGNAASVTTSNGEGSAYTIPGTGVMMNNMLGEADLHPTGFHDWQENVRISSMMAPTMLLKNHQPELVLGSGGSNRIRTAIVQVISNMIDFQMPVDVAVNSPRVHWENGVFNLEPGFASQALDQLLMPQPLSHSTPLPSNEKWVAWEQKNMFFGGVHAVAMAIEGADPGVLFGGGDRRRNGCVAIT